MSSGFESLGRVRLQGILLLLIVFLIGGLAGFAIEHARAPRFPGRGMGGPPFQRPRGLSPGLRDELKLTAEQETKINGILENGRPRTDAVLDQFLPRLRLVADSIRAEVRAVLTPEQQAIFDRQQPAFGPPLDREGFRGGPPGAGPPPEGGPPEGGTPRGPGRPRFGPRRGR